MNYICEDCVYSTQDQPNYIKHCKTAKHLKIVNKHIKTKDDAGTMDEILKRFDKLENDNLEMRREIKELKQENAELEEDMRMMQETIDYFINRFISVHIILKDKFDVKLIDDNSEGFSNECRNNLTILLQKGANEIAPVMKKKEIIEIEENKEIENEEPIEEITDNNENEVIRVDKKALEKRKKERKRKEKEIIAQETEKEKQNNKEQKIEISNNLINNFKPINPPNEYMKKAIQFIRKLFKQQKMDIVGEFDESITSDQDDQIMLNYNEIQSLLTDNPNFFKDGCNLKYELKCLNPPVIGA